LLEQGSVGEVALLEQGSVGEVALLEQGSVGEVALLEQGSVGGVGGRPVPDEKRRKNGALAVRGGSRR
jgi:hypothetical protein